MGRIKGISGLDNCHKGNSLYKRVVGHYSAFEFRGSWGAVVLAVGVPDIQSAMKTSLVVGLLAICSCQKISSEPDEPENWWEYPAPLNAIKLSQYKARMEANNLFDSYPKEPGRPRRCSDPVLGTFGRAPSKCQVEENQYRTVTGTCNDFENPAAGSRLYRFGRNIPLNESVTDNKNLLIPNPREISQKLLTRHKFIPATSINLLVPAWIQFMVHDWFDHGKNEKSEPFSVPPVTDELQQFSGGRGRGRQRPVNGPMEIRRTRQDRCSQAEGFSRLFHKLCIRLQSTSEMCQNTQNERAKTFQNTVTHWWDGSQLYGSDTATNKRVRTFLDGKLYVEDNGRLPVDKESGIPITGSNNNWWVGLGLMHNLWTLEHNYVCDELKSLNPSWDDEKLFQTARLIVTAVIAKIHTLEWTTAILNNSVAKLGLKSNWYGVTLAEFVDGNKTLEAIIAQQHPALANGIPGAIGNPQNNRGVPFSLTEEFVAVYRLHPLLPDHIAIKDAKTGKIVNKYSLPETSFRKAESVLEDNSIENIYFTFGNDHPGSMTLNNYPKFLTNRRVDLATVDILRDRERGIPRYNEFRRQIHMKPISSFEDLNNDPAIVKQLQEVYDDIEQIDLLIGSLAESPLPSGFGFSDTFFRIFVLMARRRLEADRFYTDDYTSEFYTQWGLDYIDSTWMTSVLTRHYPGLSTPLTNVKNVFAPWLNQS